MIAAGSRIADQVIIDPFGGAVVVGENFYLGPYSVMLGFGGIHIGNNVMIGPHVTVIASSHSFYDLSIPMREQPIKAKGISIGSDVWIGAGVRILDGVVIGSGAVIGAGAVVTVNVGTREIWAGVPAKCIGVRSIVETPE